MFGKHMFNPFRRKRTQRTIGVLRTAVGAAMGTHHTRRGSAIVLAVGALVLLSVLTLVYWGIGRSDVRTATTARQSASVDKTVDRFADYLAGVIARDKTAWYVEKPGTGTGDPPSVYREAWDFPWVDWTRESTPSTSNPRAFDRARFDPAGTMPESWDPLNTGLDMEKFDASDPWLAPHKPIFMGMNSALTRLDWLFESRDWWSISNFAPDGRFVNLYNLRNNFEAESGFFQTTGTRGSISDDLNLLDDQGRRTNALDNDTPANPNIPAHWTMRQRYAFRPTIDLRYGYNSRAHAFYQWADADGDGFFDSRWFELVDASVRDRIISLLPQDDTFRWFFAARAVDLSGLANLNTMNDLRGGLAGQPSLGDKTFPVGSTPADLDLLRLLQMQDSVLQYEEDGYVNLFQPFDDPTGSIPTAADYSGYDAAEAPNIGQAADDARNASFEDKLIPPPGPVTPTSLSARGRYERYTVDAMGVLPGQAMYKPQGRGTGDYTVLPQFDLPSLLELLTYRGTNDDANLSPLERVMGGRDDTGFLSPLRDNRPLLLERLHSEWAIGQNPQTGFAGDKSMIWSAMDVRQLLTTISGADDIRSSRLRFDSSGTPQETVRSFLEATSTIGGQWDATRGNANFEGRYFAPDVLRQATLGNPRLLFEAYAKALLPHVAELDEDWITDPDDQFLFYGYNPVRALISAAHMTANAADMYDRSGVTVLTVATSREAADDLDDDEDYPAWNWRDSSKPLNDPNAFPYRMILPQGERQDKLIPNEVPAVNIFGIEPQPFVIEANAYIMYSDVWLLSPNGGDRDGGPYDPNNLQPGEPFTINGDLLDSNVDFIMQAVAFQVTNPFDRSVTLWNPGEGQSKYYIEFDGHTFPLGGVPLGGSHRIPDDYARLFDENSTLMRTSIPAGETKVFYALSFEESEINLRLDNTVEDGFFTTDFSEWTKTQFGDDAIQIPVMSNAAGNLVELVRRGLPREEATVRLWRTLDLDSAGSGEQVQIRDDDQLVDRLRDPGDGGSSISTLDRSLPPGQNDVGGSNAYYEDQASGAQRDDNEGYSIVRSGSIRRGPDVGSAATAATRGEFPAWCLENKYSTSMNFEESLGGSNGITNPIQMSDFSETSVVLGTARAGTEPMDDLFDEQAGPSGQMLLATLDMEPWEKSGTVGSNSKGVSYSSIKPEIHLENDQFSGTSQNGIALRVADMLLPLAVGPMHIPKEPLGTIENDQRWTTLAETMSLALSYDTLPPKGGTPGTNLLALMGERFDYGHLRLDTEGQNRPTPYVAFRDLDGDSEPDWDEIRGSGIPMAYNVLDVFTTNDSRFGSMRRPRLGVVNANTAPLEVLRTYPMLSPLPATSRPQWMDPGKGGPNDQSDVAASVFSYVRRGIVPSIVSTDDIIDFTNGEYFGDPDLGRDKLIRAEVTGIEGIRENPGMRSLGEFMAIRHEPGSGQGDHDIDHLARDLTNITIEGVESILYESQTLADQLTDDYDEKLALVNSMIGTASVRSDYFAVWFIVHGYQRDDVEGLAPEDPLTPTVAKRFVMVVDRTNVQRLGDKPRILMIQEVPM